MISPLPQFCLLALLAGMLIIPSNSLAASSAANLKDTIERNKRQAEKRRSVLNRLTQKERALYTDLAQVEQRMDSLRREVVEEETRLAHIANELSQSRKDHRQLKAKQNKARTELTALTKQLWPLRVAAIRRESTLGDSWDKTDRKFTWGTKIYEKVQQKLVEIQNRGQAIEASIAQQQHLKDKAEKQLQTIDEKQKKLLSTKLAFVRDIRKIRAERFNAEQALEQILAVIDDLNYRLKGLGADRFSKMKGGLPPPVRGKRFRPVKASSRHRGIGYKTSSNSPVSAVYWGKVVHNDILRGFGRVVILSHGENYYSLYAFIENSPVAIGQEVEKGEPIGSTGFYPDAKGPGLYFELRFGQKAINPVRWLAGRK